MATHPYISGAGNIAQMVAQLRRNFPTTLSSDTVKKFGIAPNNESYVINALHFVGIIDEEGNRTADGADVFSHHRDEDFAPAFGELVKEAYKELFGLYGDAGWELGKDDLITFFRRNDGTGTVIGTRQAATFQVFSALSGHGEIVQRTKPAGKKNAGPAVATSSKKAAPKRAPAAPAREAKAEFSVPPAPPKEGGKRDMALTVRIEINLPAEGSMETYDNIFKSIRANLMDE